MPDQKQTRAAPADIEQRAIKKWGTTSFVGMINTVPSICSTISKELKTRLKELEAELKELGEDASDIFQIDTEAAEESILLGPQSRVLTKVLYRMSIFFASHKVVSLSFIQKGTKVVPAIRLHMELGSLRSAETKDPLDLDPFNQYVFLHLLPFIRNEWKERREDKNWKKYCKAIEEVVHAKIEALNTPKQPPVEEE